MANEKISQMATAVTLTGAELVPIVQSGANVQTSVDTLLQGDGTGQILLTHGSITSPTSYVDFTLPTGYDSFRMEWTGVVLSVLNSLCFAVSQDGGATWINDYTNLDSYNVQYFSANPAPVNNAVFSDGLGYMTDWATAGNFSSAVVNIHPGAAGYDIAIWGQGGQVVSNAPIILFYSNCLKATATIPPTLVRINAIRCLAYGSGNATTPTQTINLGKYFLWGLKG